MKCKAIESKEVDYNEVTELKARQKKENSKYNNQ
jgi:hypothetical protein